MGSSSISLFKSNSLVSLKFCHGKYVFLFQIGHLMDLYDYFIHMRKQDTLLHKFMPNAPYIVELNKNISLILLNSHMSVNEAKPHLPNMIEIGGFHVDETKDLPKVSIACLGHHLINLHAQLNTNFS